MTANNFKLELVIFIVGVSVILLEAVDPSDNQFNAPHQFLESIILHGARNQKPETSILTARISNNVKENSNLELLGGYRPLFPPYFPLKNPNASKKVYFDHEYYTRGTDEILLDNNNNNNENSQNLEIQSQQIVPLIQNTQIFFNKNTNLHQEARSSRIDSSSVIRSKNNQYLPTIISTHSSSNNNNHHQVTYITYQ
ncbi:protein dopey homolog PFC0245c-like [Leptopilina boulardi]|uniref:protein dopey homolog PFC0245c-like n=1 Tax=Leptopilina boulardi TaxID=63433 RepID=UPI0021F5FFD1|nr:protein dopey homolog PFC0245c-like [Leptopilina boulardi]